MCDICGWKICPAACPGNRDITVECACCREDVYLHEIAEVLDDDKILCTECVQFGDPAKVERVRQRHSLPLIEQIRRWARV